MWQLTLLAQIPAAGFSAHPPAIQKQHWHSREAQIEPPLIECECEWAFRIRALVFKSKSKYEISAHSVHRWPSLIGPEFSVQIDMELTVQIDMVSTYGQGNLRSGVRAGQVFSITLLYTTKTSVVVLEALLPFFFDLNNIANVVTAVHRWTWHKERSPVHVGNVRIGVVPGKTNFVGI